MMTMPTPNKDTSGNVPFVDTVCHQSNFMGHISDIDCHYQELTRMLNALNLYTSIIPYPLGKTLTPSRSKPPRIFRLDKYEERLNHTKTIEVYDQYSVVYIHETIAAGRTFKPLYRITPLNTNITFFKSTFDATLKPNPEMTRLMKNDTYSITHNEFQRIQNGVLPTDFNWNENADLTRPTDQGTCGSCWAIAASTCLSDVFVATRRSTNPMLSAGYVLSCYPQKQCEGGNPYLALNDMMMHGARSSDCIPNTLPIHPCTCNKEGPAYYPSEIKVVCIPPNLSQYSKLDAELIQSYLNSMYGTNTTMNLSQVPAHQIQNIIKDHMYHNGPVVGGFHVFKNFVKGDFRETNDIYMEKTAYQGVPGLDYSELDRDWIGSHAVVIVGWGETQVRGVTIPYWLCRNSWGETWGIGKGFFKMAMYPHNTVSQFEYPSLVVSELGHGLTGGVIMIKAGDIRYDTAKETVVYQVKEKSYVTRIVFFFMFTLGIVLLIMLKRSMSFSTLLFSFIMVVYLLLFVLYFTNM